MPADRTRPASWPLLWLTLASVLMAWQMFAFIDAHAVNILFWDLWDIYPQTLFADASAWDLIRHQVGKTRQGPGFLITRLVADATSMNTRAESFAIGTVFCLALLAAIVLKRRLAGRFHLTDLILPLLVLSSVQQDTWVGVPNLSVGAMPLLFLLLVCAAWTIRRPALRVVAVVAFNICLVNSGYGLIAGPIAPALFTVDLIHALRGGRRRDAALAAAGIAGTVAAVLLFLHGWVLNFGGECPGSGLFAHTMLPGFVVLMFGKFIGLDFDYAGLLSTLVGTLIFFVMLEAFLRRGRQVVRRREGGGAVDRVVVTLIGFTMLYAFLTAYGRACDSFLTSQASRYMTFLIPAFLGLYLDMLLRVDWRWRRYTMAALVAVALMGASSVALITDDGAARISDAKRRWRDCYLRTEDAGRCDRETKAQVYPWETERLLPPKLEYLKANRLNLYGPAAE